MSKVLPVNVQCLRKDCGWSQEGLLSAREADDLLERHILDEHTMVLPERTGEVRVVNATGGAKGVKPARFDLVPADIEWQLAEHFAKGAEKYGDRNWELGVDWSCNYAAMRRHLAKWWQGEDLDEEGNKHLLAVMWHCASLLTYSETHPDLDDRPKR